MKLITSTAIVLATGLSATAAAAQMGYGAPPPPPQNVPRSSDQAADTSSQNKINVSPKAIQAISELQKAVTANDVANIPAKLAAAQAVAKTKEDHYVIGQLQLKAAVAAKDNVASAAAADAILASGYLDPTKTAGLYNAIGVQFYNSKQFPQAAAQFQKAASLSPNDPQPLKLLAEAQNSLGQHAEGAATLQKALQLSTAAGQKPEESLYKRAVGMAYDAKAPNAVELGREWVAAYPSPDSWGNALAIYRNVANPGAAAALDYLRLAQATDSMRGTGEYHEYAYAAADEANYGEAKAIMASGLASGKIKATDPIVQEIQGVLKAKPTPTAADLAAAEKGAAVPTAFLRVGDRYYGAGNYAKAADLYRQALAKGADSNLANLRLGEALAQGGDKAGATAAFNAVSGPLSGIAKFWLVYVQHKA